MEWQRVGWGIITHLWYDDDASTFYYPVTLDDFAGQQAFDDYLRIIRKPMDFTTVQNNLTDNKYRSVKEYKSDVKMIFDNCCKYNIQGSDAFLSAKRLEKMFEGLCELRLSAYQQNNLYRS